MSYRYIVRKGSELPRIEFYIKEKLFENFISIVVRACLYVSLKGILSSKRKVVK